MKKTFLAMMALSAFLACTKGEGEAEADAAYPLKAFAVQVESSYYNAVIDQFQNRVEIGALEDLSVITGVEYTLGSETAVIRPDPKEFMGKWEKSQTIVVNDNGRETAYDIVFTLYEPDLPGTPEQPGAARVLFFDDFDGEAVDETVWKLCANGASAWNKWFDDEAGWRNVQVENGELVLTADKDGRYRNGGIRTVKGFPVGSLVEVRARFTKVGGGFPAIWQMPVGGLAWPRSGEIDIMEWVQGSPNALYHTIHTFGTDAAPDKSTYRTSTMQNTDEWHTYGAARTAEAVIFYLDGKELWRYTNQHQEDGGVQYPFANWDFDLILNYSLGGANTWPGPINDNALPAFMRVDWVKVTEFNK